MSRRGYALMIAAALGLAGLGAAAAWSASWWPMLDRLRRGAPAEAGRAPQGPPPTLAELEPGRPGAIRLPVDVAERLRIRAEEAVTPRRSRVLSLSGALAIDTNRLAHVHTRFVGEVVEVGQVPDPSASTADEGATRPLRFGDRVERGQVLAVLWSSELGEKKGEYVEALSRLRLERETLARQENLFREGASPERNVREARRAVEAAEIAAATAERTLRSWRLDDREIDVVRAEAERVRTEGAAEGSRQLESGWARVELRAPLPGTVLEKNLAVGDIVDTQTDLFKIADLSSLRAWAYVYEEDLPALLALPQPIPWTIHLKSDPAAPPIAGAVEKIGAIIDPSQHTALVVGPVDNPDGRLRAGQFITAEVELPPGPDEVEVPIAALVEDGQESVVFVQPDPAEPVYALRRVSVVRRSGRVAHVLGRPGGEPPTGYLRPGERVVVSGAVELRAALLGLEEAARHAEGRTAEPTGAADGP